MLRIAKERVSGPILVGPDGLRRCSVVVRQIKSVRLGEWIHAAGNAGGQPLHRPSGFMTACVSGLPPMTMKKTTVCLDCGMYCTLLTFTEVIPVKNLAQNQFHWRSMFYTTLVSYQYRAVNPAFCTPYYDSMPFLCLVSRW